MSLRRRLDLGQLCDLLPPLIEKLADELAELRASGVPLEGAAEYHEQLRLSAISLEALDNLLEGLAVLDFKAVLGLERALALVGAAKEILHFGSDEIRGLLLRMERGIQADLNRPQSPATAPALPPRFTRNFNDLRDFSFRRENAFPFWEEKAFESPQNNWKKLVAVGFPEQLYHLIPSQYKCEMMDILMDKPVTLPLSLQVLDRSSLVQALRTTHGRNPYNREAMTINDALPKDDLEEEIKQYVNFIVAEAARIRMKENIPLDSPLMAGYFIMMQHDWDNHLRAQTVAQDRERITPKPL